MVILIQSMESFNKFNHLKIHSQYSICEGALKIDELSEFCKKKKIKALGLSDSFNLCGALEFSESISKSGTQPILGTQINFEYKNVIGKIPLIAKSEDGYKSIIKLSSKSFLQTSELDLMNAAGNEDMIKATQNGAVELYHDNDLKLQTHTTGFNLQGGSNNVSLNLETTDGTRRGSAYANDSNMVGFLDAGGDWAIQHQNDSHTKFFIQTTLKVRIDADGLKFGNDTAAANALHDYEEGTAIPDFANADNSIVTVNHYHYTKVGRLVHFEAKFTVGSNNDGSGFGFTLPVAQAGSRETVIPAISTRSSPNNPFAFVVNANQNYAYAKALQGYGTSAIEYQDFAGSIILVSGTYEAA